MVVELSRPRIKVIQPCTLFKTVLYMTCDDVYKLYENNQGEKLLAEVVCVCKCVCVCLCECVFCFLFCFLFVFFFFDR